MCDSSGKPEQPSRLEALRLISKAACYLIAAGHEGEAITRELVQYVRENGNVSANKEARRGDSRGRRDCDSDCAS